MFVLTVEVGGDWDFYTENVFCSSNKCEIEKIKSALNDFCANHPLCHQDVCLRTEFSLSDDNLFENKLFCTIFYAVYENSELALNIYKILKKICNGYSVYIYSDTFNVIEIPELQL